MAPRQQRNPRRPRPLPPSQQLSLDERINQVVQTPEIQRQITEEAQRFNEYSPRSRRNKFIELYTEHANYKAEAVKLRNNIEELRKQLLRLDEAEERRQKGMAKKNKPRSLRALKAAATKARIRALKAQEESQRLQQLLQSSSQQQQFGGQLGGQLVGQLGVKFDGKFDGMQFNSQNDENNDARGEFTIEEGIVEVEGDYEEAYKQDIPTRCYE